MSKDSEKILKQLQQEGEALGLYDEPSLKNCPHCGSEAQFGKVRLDDFYIIKCTNQDCDTQMRSWKKEKAIANWNTRPERDEKLSKAYDDGFKYGQEFGRNDVLDEVLGELEFSSKSYFTFEELKQLIKAKGAE